MHLACRALLFDLDGVLVDSTASVERIWERWADERGLDMEEIRPVMHGRPSGEVVRSVAPGLDAAAEAELLDGLQARDDSVEEVRGAGALLASLPEGAWTVVTSGRRELATARLGFAGIPIPGTMVCVDDVSRGKPEPEPYLTGASRIGVDPADCVVVEDAPAGIKAARAAGMRVVALTTTHEEAELPGAEVVLPDLRSVRARRDGDGLALELYEG